MWVRGPKRRRDFQGLCSAAGKCSGFGGFRQSSSRPSLFLLLWSGARGFGRESTRGKLLLHGRQALWCWAGVWVRAEASCASVRDQPEPCSSWPRRGEKTTQILQDCFPQLRFSSLFALRSIRGRRCASKPWWSLPAGISAAPVQGCKSEGCKSEQGDPLLAVGSWSQSALKLVFARAGWRWRMAAPCLLSFRGGERHHSCAVAPDILSYTRSLLKHRRPFMVALAQQVAVFSLIFYLPFPLPLNQHQQMHGKQAMGFPLAFYAGRNHCLLQTF